MAESSNDMLRELASVVRANTAAMERIATALEAIALQSAAHAIQDSAREIAERSVSDGVVARSKYPRPMRPAGAR